MRGVQTEKREELRSKTFPAVILGPNLTLAVFARGLRGKDLFYAAQQLAWEERLL